MRSWMWRLRRMSDLTVNDRAFGRMQAGAVQWRSSVRLLGALAALALTVAARAQDGPEAGILSGEAGPGVPVFGYVLWPGHDVSASQVRLCSDPRCRDVVTCAETTGPNGAVFTALDPGRYYVMAISDQDSDGRVGPGDGLGFYGAYQMDDEPAALVVEEGAEAVEVSVPISFVISDEGRLVNERVLPPSPLVVEDQTTISGTVTGLGAAESAYVVLVPLVPIYPARACTVSPDGSFALDAAPGSYHLIAVETAGASPRIGTGDRVGLYRQEDALASSATLLRVVAGQPVEGVRVALDWRVASDGRLRSQDGSELGPRLQSGNLPGICTGKVTRQGEAVTGALVQAFAGDDRNVPLYEARTDAQGTFCLGLTAGTYGLVATLDRDDDGAGRPDEPRVVVKTVDGGSGEGLLVRPGSVFQGLTAELP